MMIRRRALTWLLAVPLLSCKGGDAPTAIDFTISPQEAELLPGETLQMTATGDVAGLTWSSSDNGVATVGASTGLVTAVGRGTATISAVAGSVVRSATIAVRTPPQIGVPADVEFEITEGDADPPPQFVDITNAGDGTLEGVQVGAAEYLEGEPTGWLTVQLSGTRLTLLVRRSGLPPGEYHASIPVTSTNAINSPQSILITFRIVPRPRIAVSQDPVFLTATPGGSDSETVEITNGGGRTLEGLRVEIAYPGARDWLEAELAGTAAPTTITLTARAGQLPIGSYVANAVLSSSQPGITPFLLRVAFSVTSSPQISLSRESVRIDAVVGGDPPQPETVVITNGGGGELSGLALGTIQYGAGASDWLQASLTDHVAPATLTLVTDPGDLAPGSFTATVPVTSDRAGNSPRNVQVLLVVGSLPSITATPQSLTFGTVRNGNVPPAQTVAIGSNGAPIDHLSHEVIYEDGHGWLDVEWTGGTSTPSGLSVRPNSAMLERGSYHATIRVTSNNPDIRPRDIPVTFMVATFEVDIFPLFTASDPGGFPRLPCTQCHEAFENPDDAHAYLTAQSEVLMCKITGGAACPDEMRMPPMAVNRIQAWLNAGMPR